MRRGITSADIGLRLEGFGETGLSDWRPRATGRGTVRSGAPKG